MSLIDNLGAKRQRAIAKQKKVVFLPRWEDEGLKVSVTYKLADKDTLKKVTKLGDLKRGNSDALFNFYLQFHVDHAVEISFDDGSEVEVFRSPAPGVSPFGDERLGEALKLPDENGDVEEQQPSARDNVLALFIAELDVMGFGDAVIEWSGTTREQIEEAAAGE